MAALTLTLSVGARGAAAVAPATLNAVLADAVAPAVTAGATLSLAVVGGTGGPPLAGDNAGERLGPGAAWSAVTAAAALWHLGASYVTTTTVVAPAPRSGTILGSLVLVGGADPLMTQAQLATLAQTVAKRARTVTGGVLVDGAILSYPQLPTGWPLDEVEGDAAPPAAALAVQGDALTVTVTPAKVAGEAATVAVAPIGLVPVTGTVQTVKTPGAAGPVVGAGPDAITVTGSVRVGAAPVVDTLYPPDPSRLAATLFRQDLARDGVTVQGAVGTGLPVSGDTVVASVASPPLSRWLPALWPGVEGAAPSPLTAEDLFRLLCRPTAARPCGSPSDAQVVLDLLAASGAAPGTAVHGGSGLSVTDLVSATTLADVLRAASLHPWGKALLASLPPLGTLLPGAPAGAVGLYGEATGGLSLLAELPGANGGDPRFVALLGASVETPALARSTALSVLAALDGGNGAPVASTPSRPAARDVGLDGAGSALTSALDEAGPGSVDAVTAWPVGSASPAVNDNGAALLPATGIVPLFVGAAALPGASAATRLTTRLVVDGTLSGDTLNGSIGIVAGLDPTLSSADLVTLAADVRALGVRRVTDGVAVDDLALPPTVPMTWPWPWLGDLPAVGGDALTVGDGLYSVAILPGKRAGTSPTIEVVPASTPVGITNEAFTVAGAADTLALWPDPASGRLVVTGTIGLADRLGKVLLRVAPDPGLAGGALLLQDLKADGIAVTGGVRRTSIPAVAPTMASLAGTTLLALDQSLIAAPTPTAAWDAAAIAGGALRGVSGLAAVDGGLARAAGLLLHDGRGAPAPVLSEPFGVGTDDRLSTFGCASTLATLAAAPGGVGRLPDLLPIMPGSTDGGMLRAMVGVGTGGGSLAGYYLPTKGRPVAVCVTLSSMDRDSAPALAAIAQAAVSTAAPPVRH